MPALEKTEVVRVLLRLALTGTEIPKGLLGFLLEEDLAMFDSASPRAVARALLDATQDTAMLLERVRRRQ